uniref:HECT-type E3 ubiquitin transferase n=1 Tax=Schizophyllum commune (strain H4-8 / FGSC 9210) TaxID=578458 RepID=D8Q152_SCHCM
MGEAHLASDVEDECVDEDAGQHDEGPRHDEEDDDHPFDDDDDGDDGEDSGMGGSGGPPPIPDSLDESTAMAILGDYRQFGSYMLSLSSRIKTLLNNIKPTADPTTRLISLQELSELLSISTEDTLAGSFPVESFVRELVKILGGRGSPDEDDEDGDEDGEKDEDAALAAALAMSTGGAYAGDENLEAQVLACRCLANLMEALPGVAHTVVYHGAIPVLCSKLIEISYIDLAEQTLSTMEKISEEFPSSIVREGGLSALLNYLDFFSIAVQRTALQAASNCCRNISPDHFTQIKGVWPIIRNCLSYSDSRLVEFACMCVVRVIDAYHRNSVGHLEALVDTDLIRAVNLLLLPAGGSPLIAPNTFSLLLRALATSARASPKITISLLEAGIVDTLYQILTGVLPSAASSSSSQGESQSGQGLGGGLADMTVMENLAHRPKEQVEEALSLISELMPPLPKDGVFDHKSYTEKSLARLIKAKAKADRAAARQAAQAPFVAALLLPEPTPATASSTPTGEEPSETAAGSSTPAQGDEASVSTSTKPAGAPVSERTQLMRSHPDLVGTFMQLTVPILIDVYAASVNLSLRTKTLTGLLKAISFLDAEGLKRVLAYVPVAGFVSSVLSSRDHPSLVIGALQLVDLLLSRVPGLYKPSFRREGVFHEIESLAARELVSKKDKEAKDKDSSEGSAAESASAAAPPPPVVPSSIPGYKKLTSLALDPEDAITLRSRVMKFKYMVGDEKDAEDDSFANLRRIVETLSNTKATEKMLSRALNDLAELFASPHTSVSSFELLQSGLVDGLLQFMTDAEQVPVAKRRELFLDSFAGGRVKGFGQSQSPYATIVKKLQESLTRMESFDVVTVAQGIDDSKRSSPSLLARQLRLRLVADEDSDIPRSLNNIVVSIHAIATFQALHDYLRPRVSGLLGRGPTSFTGMLAAALAAGGLGRLRDELPSTSAAPPPPATSSSASAPVIGRRRSQRLSAKTTDGTQSVPGEPANPPADPGASASAPVGSTPTEEAAESLANLVDAGLEADFTDDEVDAEVMDEDEDPDNSVADKTITLNVGEDGENVEAQTPDGTRVATPNPPREAPKPASSAKPSYAAALKSKPADWHLEFSMDDQVLPLDLTIYGAVHQQEMRKKEKSGVPGSVDGELATLVGFDGTDGAQARSETSEAASKSRAPSPTLTSLPEDAPHAKILRLLRAFHDLNLLEGERSAFVGEKRTLPESSFVNNKLTAKLTRQLEEPMIVASSCLPDWALDLPQHFPFLFPFATRYNFLQSTSFGYARLILKWQAQQSRGQDSSRRDDGIGFLGRLQRQKVRISRKHLLESAVKVFELYGSSSSVLEVEYFEEVGTGLGPTLEFYALVSKEFARKDLKLWRDADAASKSLYVDHPAGLYPAPIGTEDLDNDGGHKRTHLLRVIGQFVAKAMLDSRIIDLSFNKVFMKLVLGEEVPLTIATLKLVDQGLADSLVKIQNIVSGKQPQDKVCTDKSYQLAKKVAMVEGVTIEDLALDFTLPGYDIELRPGGRNVAVTAANVDEYIHDILDAILGKGAQEQAAAFREGFSKVFPISDLRAFTADELVLLFGNGDEDWSIETLTEALKADHGFNSESRSIRNLVEIMANYDPPTRRMYLQFITGSPKLPIGGFRGLNPPLTVVRKPHEAPLKADDYLPSVMTCVNYLKLPEYSTKDVMREKLRVAMLEGVGSFHLS